MLWAASWILLAAAAPLTGTLIFRDDSHVEEIKTPAQLRQFLDRISEDRPGSDNAQDDVCAGSAFIMLYSSWCPHCHAFQPVWTSLAARLSCTDKLRIAAFECTTAEADRVTPLDQWSRLFGGNFTFPKGEADSHVIKPRDICASILHETYPSLLLVTPSRCKMSADWQPFTEGSGGVEWSKHFNSDLNFYHIGVQSHSTAADDLISQLSDIASDCHPLDKVGEERTILEYLKALNDTKEEQTRWDKNAQTLDPDRRYYDAILGFYHILTDWVDTEELTSDQQNALKNLVLLTGASLPALDDRRRALSVLLNDTAPITSQVKAASLSGIAIPEETTKASKLCESSSCHVWTFFHLAFGLQRLQEEMYGANRTCLSLFGTGVDSELVGQIDQAVKDDDSLRSLCVKPVDVSDVMHQIVVGFFKCKSCQEHFDQGYRQCAADRCEWLQSYSPKLASLIADDTPTPALAGVLWLWRFHNIVNVRTATDKAMLDLRSHFEAGDNDADYRFKYFGQDVRMPTSTMCTDCRKSDIPPLVLASQWMLAFVESNEDESAMAYDQIEDFNLSRVSDFMETFYIKKAWSHARSLIWAEGEGLKVTTGVQD